ncbi:MAG: serine hydrolase domain-containing protein [Stellaceae bacterium]
MQNGGARSRSFSAAVAEAARNAALALGLALLPAIAQAATPGNCGAPADLHDGWTVASPAQEGLDPKLICAIGPRLEKMPLADANGVVVVRHGTLVYEHYFTGDDQRWPELHRGEPPGEVPHNASTLHDLQSITKSVVALLVGVASDRGRLANLNAPVFPFFPRYADLNAPDKGRITLHELLAMTSGLFWPAHAVSYDDPSNIARRMWEAPDPYRFVLAQTLEATPGTEWNYDGGGVELLGAVLKKVTGRQLDRLAKETLFDPLGIKDWEWARLANGEPAASWGLRLRPRDLAKIGQLVLNQGVWHGRRIVSAAWVKEMTASHLPRGWLLESAGASSYGYLWWLGHASIDNRDTDWVAGFGYGGQRLYVVPSQDLVVTVTAGIYKFRGPQGLAGDTALDMVLRAAANSH